jgi:Lhr-like helicase
MCEPLYVAPGCQSCPDIGRYAIGELYDTNARSRRVLIFVNTRSQGEFVFRDLWRATRLTQRIRRANHRLDEPSAALLEPFNRF